MSRTYSHRPQWVKLNDPKFPTKERHQHHVIKREKTGRLLEYKRYLWKGFSHEDSDREIFEEVITQYPEYHSWSENVPCTIDVPEVSWREERHRDKVDPTIKLCDKRPLYRIGCPCCTRAYAKKLSAKAQRASINQQLHNSVRDYGWTTDPDDWYDVDITTAGVAEDWDFWD